MVSVAVIAREGAYLLSEADLPFHLEVCRAPRVDEQLYTGEFAYGALDVPC